MTSDKQTQQFARKLLALSKGSDGGVDAERVAAILATLKKNPPRSFKIILEKYLVLIKRAIRARTATIEHAGAVDESIIAEIQAAMTAHYGFEVSTETQSNEALIAGIRVRIGDDVFDNSVSGRLTRLEAAT